jgi:hypothetical protein
MATSKKPAGKKTKDLPPKKSGQVKGGRPQRNDY